MLHTGSQPQQLIHMYLVQTLFCQLNVSNKHDCNYMFHEYGQFGLSVNNNTAQ